MYAIIGATGHTGGVVAKTLLAQNQIIRAIGRNSDRLTSLVDRGADPFVAESTDAIALAKAFAGAKAVYVMLPPDMSSSDYRAFQDRVTEAIATAIERARVEYAVVLSSVGADKPDKTGPVVGLHNLEQRLNQIPGLNALYLRAGYFMENTLPQIQNIKDRGAVLGPVRPDLKLPMIATRDIGAAAAAALSKLDFRGKQTRELLGPRDLNMVEATQIISKAIDKPELSYGKISEQEFHKALTQMGMLPGMADLMVEMVQALNSGYMRALERRSAANTTPTAFESIVAEEFVPLFAGIPVEAGAI